MHIVRVAPADAGWVVKADRVDNDLMFKSGARAERAARRLAEALAETGEPVKLYIHARDGSVVGRLLCAPPAEMLSSERQAAA